MPPSKAKAAADHPPATTAKKLKQWEQQAERFFLKAFKGCTAAPQFSSAQAAVEAAYRIVDANTWHELEALLNGQGKKLDEALRKEVKAKITCFRSVGNGAGLRAYFSPQKAQASASGGSVPASPRAGPSSSTASSGAGPSSSSPAPAAALAACVQELEGSEDEEDEEDEEEDDEEEEEAEGEADASPTLSSSANVQQQRREQRPQRRQQGPLAPPRW